MSELQAHNAREKDSLLPVGYLVALNRALDELGEDYHWEVIYLYGELDSIGTEILRTMETQVSFGPGEEKIIYWGCSVFGPRVAFVCCLRDQIPPRFLIPS